MANASDASTAITVGVMAHSANVQAPLPGGCASTGDYEYNCMVDFTTPSSVTQTASITFQQGDMGITRDKCAGDSCVGHSCNCDYVVHNDKAVGGTMKYELYQTSAASCGSDYHHDIGISEVLSSRLPFAYRNTACCYFGLPLQPIPMGAAVGASTTLCRVWRFDFFFH